MERTACKHNGPDMDLLRLFSEFDACLEAMLVWVRSEVERQAQGAEKTRALLHS